MLERENDLDPEVKYGTEQFVDAQPEVMEARVGEGHYSKRNVARQAKRQKSKTIILQQRQTGNKTRPQKINSHRRKQHWRKPTVLVMTSDYR